MTLVRVAAAGAAIAVLATGGGVRAQVPTAGPSRVGIHVRETVGIRRSSFPATAHVPFAAGRFRADTPSRLRLDGRDVPSQATVMDRWSDGSARIVDVDFNASPGPDETLDFVFEYGDGVTAAAPPRGLTFTERGDGFQIGAVRVSNDADPLLASVAYRDEAIGAGANGFSVTVGDAEIPLTSAAGTVAVLKRGPLVAVLAFTGMVTTPGGPLPYTITLEMPSSKSWVKLSASVADERREVQGLSLATPLALGPLPWVWDVGTARWSYGQLRAAGDTMAFEQSPPTIGSRWQITTTSGGRAQVVEAGTSTRWPFAGWAHVQGTKEVVALAVEEAPLFTGTVRLSQAAAGEMRVRLTPSTSSARQTLTVYEHFVATPVQIGAATSPAAILAPLSVSTDAQ